MQNIPEFETDRSQIGSVAVQIPYRQVFRVLAIALTLQVMVVGVVVYYFDKTSATQIFDVSTLVSIVVFVFGSLMWGRFPSADAPMIEPEDKRTLSILRDTCEMSISNRVRGGLLMLSSILFGLGCFGLHKIFGNSL
jgi:hypothetical protein